MPSPKTTLTEKQDRSLEKKRLFAQYYAAGAKGSEAAIKAGFPASSASSKGADLLQDPDVIEVISEIRHRREQRIELSADIVQQEMWAQGMANPSDLCEWNQGGKKAELKASGQIPLAIMRRIVELNINADGSLKIRLAPNTALLTELSRTTRGVGDDPKRECLSLAIAAAMKKLGSNHRTLPKMDKEIDPLEAQKYWAGRATENKAIHDKARSDNARN